MKVTVDAASLRAAIDWAAGHTGTQVPIVSAVVLDATADGALIASGFDYDTWAEQTAEAHVVTAGKVAVSGRLARAVAKALPGDGRVDLSADAATLGLAAGRLRASLPLMPVEDYPSRPAMPAHGLTLPASLGRVLAAAAPLAADHEDKETGGSGCGCALELDPAGVRTTAISRYRMFTSVLPWPHSAHRSSIPHVLPLTAASTKALAELASDGSEPGLGLPGPGQNVLSMDCGGRTLGCRTSAANVIDWRKLLLIAVAPVRSLAADTAELAGLVKRLTPTNEAADVKERRHLRVDVGGGALRLATERAADAIDVATDGPWDADPWPMLIDSGYLLDVVTAADAETVRIDFTGPNAAWRITRPGSEAFSGVVMPIRIPKEGT